MKILKFMFCLICGNKLTENENCLRCKATFNDHKVSYKGAYGTRYLIDIFIGK